MSLPNASRGPFEGVRQIFALNWPFYAASVGAVAATQTVLRLRSWPRWAHLLGAAGCSGALWWTAASLAASHWAYDRSPLMRWHWLLNLFPISPRRWANIHCGLDESSIALQTLFPTSESTIFDIFKADEMTEPSINRVRQNLQSQAVSTTSIAADYANLPLPNEALDAVFLLFAAHELRLAAAREKFFGEIARVLARGGQAILVEHPRDAANFAAFGPGFFHFWPRREWRRLARFARLKIKREFGITPFVRVWVLQK